MKLNSRKNLSGQILVIVIIVLLILAGGYWYLSSTKAAADRDARQFGHEVINKLVINHDRAFLDQDLSPEAKMEMPPSQRDYLVQRFTQMGLPQQPIDIEDNISFEPLISGWLANYTSFLSPHGIFTAHLNYPAQPVTLQLAISHPQTKWQIDNIMFTMGATPR
jgi:hypothetical protein